MKVLSGNLLEYKLIPSRVDFNIQKKHFFKGDINFLSNSEFHKIHAVDVSHSLHLYSPPNFYDK